MYGCLSLGHGHVAAEAARLLTRLWAPSAGRGGSAPWAMPASKEGAGALQTSSINPEDSHNAQQAKDVALKQPGR